VKAAARRAGIQNLAPHDLRRTCARLRARNHSRISPEPRKIADGRVLLVYNARHLRLGVPP
jgi:integrase